MNAEDRAAQQRAANYWHRQAAQQQQQASAAEARAERIETRQPQDDAPQARRSPRARPRS